MKKTNSILQLLHHLDLSTSKYLISTFKKNKIEFYHLINYTILIILRFICDNVIELIEKSSSEKDLKSITLNTYDIHEDVS